MIDGMVRRELYQLNERVQKLETELIALKKNLFGPFPKINIMNNGIVKYTTSEGEVSFYDAIGNKIMSLNEYLEWCNTKPMKEYDE